MAWRIEVGSFEQERRGDETDGHPENELDREDEGTNHGSNSFRRSKGAIYCMD